MKIKTVVRLADLAWVSLLFVVPLIAIPILVGERYSWFYPVETALAICSLIPFLFRMILLPWALKHSEEPDLLYAILDKLGMTYILFSDFTPTEGYRPTHLTSQFLTDNQLTTEIYLRKIWPAANKTPVMAFTDKGLQYDQWRLSWKEICDWRLDKSRVGHDDTPDILMVIKYFGPQQTIEETSIKIKDVGIHRVDFLLLMLYFKTKHG